MSLRIRRRPVARFVAFHDIPPSTRMQFETNLLFLKARTNVISLDDFFEGRLSSDRINVGITFDDGYKDWMDYALPALRKLELPATFFVSSGFLDAPDKHRKEFTHQDGASPRNRSGVDRCLSREDVKKIADLGFSVGGHTLSHCRLSKLGDYARVRDEICSDKKNLERITGREVKYFAYPFGATENVDLSLSSILSESGFKGALTIISGFNTPTTDPYGLHRDLTRAAMHPWVFHAKVLGNGDALTRLLGRIPKSRKRDG